MSHVVLTGGLALQTEESWKGFVGKEISWKGNDVEVYFEEDDFDQFPDKLGSIKTVEYVHPAREHAWGQRVVRFCVLLSNLFQIVRCYLNNKKVVANFQFIEEKLYG